MFDFDSASRDFFWRIENWRVGPGPAQSVFLPLSKSCHRKGKILSSRNGSWPVHEQECMLAESRRTGHCPMTCRGRSLKSHIDHRPFISHSSHLRCCETTKDQIFLSARRLMTLHLYVQRHSKMKLYVWHLEAATYICIELWCMTSLSYSRTPLLLPPLYWRHVSFRLGQQMLHYHFRISLFASNHFLPGRVILWLLPERPACRQISSDITSRVGLCR